MSLVSVVEAASLVGRDRKTLYRAIATGKLSSSQDETGQKMVDTSELVRVYGELIRQRDTQKRDTMELGETGYFVSKIQELEAENARLREELQTKVSTSSAETAVLKAWLEDKDKHLEDLRANFKLLEYRQRPWWKLF